VRVVVLGDTRRVKEGMTVLRTGKVLSVPVGEALVGRQPLRPLWSEVPISVLFQSEIRSLK